MRDLEDAIYIGHNIMVLQASLSSSNSKCFTMWDVAAKVNFVIIQLLVVI
jgi:hypothetical protein